MHTRHISVSGCRARRPCLRRPSLDFADEDGIFSAVPSGSGLLAVRPPGPVGPPDHREHCSRGLLLQSIAHETPDKGAGRTSYCNLSCLKRLYSGEFSSIWKQPITPTCSNSSPISPSSSSVATKKKIRLRGLVDQSGREGST